MFQNRILVIATKHKKETVIAPLLEANLNVKCFVLKDFDTDSFGTFTGEIARKDNAFETVRKKCLAAMAISNCDLGIASEGSFGLHSTAFFASANEEILLFIDLKNNLEITTRIQTLNTNFNSSIIKSKTELQLFAETCKFPSHGLILRSENSELIVKGITAWEELYEHFEALKANYSDIIVETDMRALYNPTRMKIIEKTTMQLIEKINSKCPNCNHPGFGIVEANKGLRCELCNNPTNSILSYTYQCSNCNFKSEKAASKKMEDPMYCNYCNP